MIEQMIQPCISIVLVSGLLCVGRVAHADTVHEPWSGTAFPAHVSLMSDGTAHQLQATGVARRRKFFVSVYAMAHYMEQPPHDIESAFTRALADTTPKQIIIEYLRDLTQEQIADSLRRGFGRNTTQQELQEIQPSVDELIAYFEYGVQRGDRYTIQWLPGGAIVFFFGDREVATITQLTFARALWAIWLGPRSVVERAHLMAWTIVD
jgi:hypothetical protein